MRTRSAFTRSRNSRRGVAMILFVALVFVFFAIAGLAIDLGTASLAQQQMQVAVDPAALEGMRLRDFNLYQFSSDQRRRSKVSSLVRQIFDDDLHPTGGVPAYGSVPAMAPDDRDTLNLGAGPMMRIDGQDTPNGFATGGTITEAAGTSTIPIGRVWDDPILQENKLDTGVVGNFNNGDMVSGTFDLNDTDHTESHDYVRSDFRPAPSPLETTQSQSEKWEALGFLVRMRRTSGTHFMDSQPGKSSHGPTIPFLWALGSLMHQKDGETWNPRKDGLTVRATAIAVGRPALRASPAPRTNPLDASSPPILGESDNPSAMLGLHPFALALDYWTTVSPGTSWASNTTNLTIGAGSTLMSGAQVRGYLVDPRTVTSVGTVIVPNSSIPLPTTLSPGYVAIYSTLPPGGGGPQRVIGYIFMDASRVPANSFISYRTGILSPGSGSTSSVKLWVAANGASAQIGFDTPALNKPDWDELFRLNRILAYGGDNNLPSHEVNYDYRRIRPGTLLAPALAR